MSNLQSVVFWVLLLEWIRLCLLINNWSCTPRADIGYGTHLWPNYRVSGSGIRYTGLIMTNFGQISADCVIYRYAVLTYGSPFYRWPIELRWLLTSNLVLPLVPGVDSYSDCTPTDARWCGDKSLCIRHISILICAEISNRVFTRSSKVPANVQQTSSWPDGTPPPISCGLSRRRA